MITKQQRDEWRRLCEEATPGPWEIEGRDSYGPTQRWLIVLKRDRHGFWEKNAGVVEKPDGEFIIAARTAMPLLLDALEEAERTLHRLDCGADQGERCRYHDSEPYCWLCVDVDKDARLEKLEADLAKAKELLRQYTECCGQVFWVGDDTNDKCNAWTALCDEVRAFLGETEGHR